MGLFDDAGVDVADIGDDPYNFGNAFWPVAVKEVREPKQTKKGDMYGVTVFFEIMHDKYANVPAFNRWIQLPTPKIIQQESGIPFDPQQNPRDMSVVFALTKFFEALGFKRNEMNSINLETDLVGKVFLARLRVAEEDGYWKISYNAPKAMPEPGSNSFEEFQKSSSAASRTDDIEAAMLREMNQS